MRIRHLVAGVVIFASSALAETQSEMLARVQKPGEVDRLFRTAQGQAAINCMFRELGVEAREKGLPFSKVNQEVVHLHYIMRCPEENTAFMDVVGNDFVADGLMQGALSQLMKK